MKTVTSFRRVLVVVAVLGVLIAPLVTANKLDGLWFKLKLSGKAHTLDGAGNVAALKVSTPMYAQFVATSNPQEYKVHFWTKVDAGWTNSFTTRTVTTIGTNENFLSDVAVTVVGLGGDSLSTFHVAFISSKVDVTGGVKSATYTGEGEIVTGDVGGDQAFGGFTLTGSTIATNKLPFTAP